MRTPSARADAARLRALVERFELDALLEQLTRDLRDAGAEPASTEPT